MHKPWQDINFTEIKIFICNIDIQEVCYQTQEILEWPKVQGYQAHLNHDEEGH